MNYKKLEKHLRSSINNEIAQKVKKLRVEKDYTWRAVCRDIAKEYPELMLTTHDDGGGYGYDGMILCGISMEFLKEKAEEGWN